MHLTAEKGVVSSLIVSAEIIMPCMFSMFVLYAPWTLDLNNLLLAVPHLLL
jgi:hypothetical protein